MIMDTTIGPIILTYCQGVRLTLSPSIQIYMFENQKRSLSNGNDLHCKCFIKLLIVNYVFICVNMISLIRI